MKFVHPDLEGMLMSDQTMILEWVIESPELFSGYVQELERQTKGGEGKFVLSEKNKELDISKNMEMIWNPFMIDINDKKSLNRLYTQLAELSESEELFMMTRQLNQCIQEYLAEMESKTPYILAYENNLNFAELLKAADVKYEVMEEDFFETLIRYLRICTEVFRTKMVVFINARSYLTDEQMDELIKNALYVDLKLLFIENREKDCISGVARYIIDIDNCEIF